MKNFDKFAIQLSSDLEYEEMIINILYERELVAILSQENGLNNMEIEIFSPDNSANWKFDFEKFLHILNSAKNWLVEAQKIPD